MEVMAVARRFRFHGVPFQRRNRRLGMDEVHGRGAKIGLAAELLRIEGGSARVVRVVATRSIIVAVDTSGAGSNEVRGGTAPLSKRRWRMIVALQREQEIKGIAAKRPRVFVSPLTYGHPLPWRDRGTRRRSAVCGR